MRSVRASSVAASVAFATLLLVAPLGRAPAIAHGPAHEMIAGLTEEIEAHPAEAILYLRRGDLRRFHGERQAAQADFERAAELDPDLAEVDLSLGILLREWGRNAEAIAALERFLRRDPDHPEGLFELGLAQLAAGRPAEAIAKMDRALALYAAPRPDHFLERARATAARGAAFIDAALAGLDEAQKRLGCLVSLQSYAIELELARGRFEEALRRLDGLEEQFDRKETLHSRRGNILEAAGRALEAQAEYTLALEAIQALPPTRRQTKAVHALEQSLSDKLRVTAPDVEPIDAAE